jgi:ribosome maturation factor RimP
MNKSREKMKEKIDLVLKSLKEGFTLRGLDIENHKKDRLIRIFVDKPGGVTINDCAKISKKISVHLDVLDYMHGPYKLEVSSPGAGNKEEK